MIDVLQTTGIKRGRANVLDEVAPYLPERLLGETLQTANIASS